MPQHRTLSDAVRIPNRNGFIARLMNLTDSLTEKDIEGIKFLCRDFNPGSNLERCRVGAEIIQDLIVLGLITDDNIDILVECLSRINRPDWIEKLCFKPVDVKQRVNKETKLKPFRVMLFNIAEDIFAEEVSKIRYYLQNILPGHQSDSINRCTTMVEAFIFCEKIGLLDETNIQIIYEMLKYLKRDDLLNEVDDYADKAGFVQSLDPPGSHVPRSGSSTTHEPMNISGSPPRLGPPNTYKGSPSYRPVNTSECPLPHNTDNYLPLCMPVNNIVPGHETVPPCFHGSDTVFPHAWSRGIANSGLSVAPLTLDVILDFSMIPNVSYEFYTTRANSSSGTSQNLHDQYGNETVSTSVPELAERRATTEAGFVAGFPKAVPHTSSPLVPLSEAIRQSQEKPETLNHYKMDADPRGMCLIINNKNFYKVENDDDSFELECREGTDIDCEKLQKLFSKLHFVVEVHHDQTDLEMYQLMSLMSKKVDHSCYDCFVCCVLSHGSEGNIFGSNGKEVPIINLTGFFLSANCPSLARKPKVFFFQACQGSKKQSGYKVEQDASDVASDASTGQVIPNEADFLLGFATVAGYASFRNTITGSWYISKLVEMLQTYHESEDVLSILVTVNRKVCEENAEFDNTLYKQTPAPTFTLTKKLYF